MKKAFLFFLFCFALFPLRAEILLSPSGKPVTTAGKFSTTPVDLPAAVIPQKEFRGVWVATVENIDFGPFRTAAEFRAAAAQLMKALAARNFNTVIFQVRSNCDAWYISAQNPWSRYLSGTEGTGIGVDPLEILIAEAHRNHLEFHAWLNPYRVVGQTPMSKKNYLQTLSAKHFARRHPECVLAAPAENKKMTTLLLDPGNENVKQYIVGTVREIVTRYRVDAIHFDDYFYPYADIGYADYATYTRCNPLKKTLGDWRRDNVTDVICRVKKEITRANRQNNTRIAFGISPFGIWANRSAHHPDGSLTGGKESYTVLCADVKKWIKLGAIDYVIPQLYWGFGHPVAAYAALAGWWAAQVKGTPVRLFTGHALYRVGSSSEFPVNEIYNQLRYNALHQEISGFSLFSAHHLFKPGNRHIANGVSLILKRMAHPASRVDFPNVR